MSTRVVLSIPRASFCVSLCLALFCFHSFTVRNVGYFIDRSLFVPRSFGCNPYARSLHPLERGSCILFENRSHVCVDFRLHEFAIDFTSSRKLVKLTLYGKTKDMYTIIYKGLS